MKRKQKIGQQRHKPFPVVGMRLHPVETDMVCAANTCQSLEFFSERPKATFGIQLYADWSTVPQHGFTEKERGELVWEKAYRDQMAGEEPDPDVSPLCAQCAAFLLTHFLGDENEQRAAVFMMASITTGKDMILFDRNLSREYTHACVALCHFESLEDFRQQYWSEVEV